MYARFTRLFAPNSLSFKLILAFLIVGLAGTSVSAVLARREITRVFAIFLNQQDRDRYQEIIVDYYQEHGSFADFDSFIRDLNDIKGDGLPPIPVVADKNGIVIASNRPSDLNRQAASFNRLDSEGIAIEDKNGEVIAYIIIPPGGGELKGESLQYLRTMYGALMRSALVAAVVALILGIFLAQRLTKPIHALTSAAQEMAQGDLSQTLPVKSKDEIGQLTQAFNLMSSELAHANELRKQMTADIAHDLRNPLLVLSGYIESLRDEVLSPTSERFDIMYNEAQQLSQLVEDLRTISLADAGQLPLQRELIEPQMLLTHTAQTYQQKATEQGVTLQVSAPEQLPTISVDSKRIFQVLSNLVSNALRYTPTNGRISLSVIAQPPYLQISIQDTGEGIDELDIPKIFDRFYRADNNRVTTTGESGLGLAIAKSIIEAHQGKISVSSQVGNGTRFDILLPLSP